MSQVSHAELRILREAVCPPMAGSTLAAGLGGGRWLVSNACYDGELDRLSNQQVFLQCNTNSGVLPRPNIQALQHAMVDTSNGHSGGLTAGFGTKVSSSKYH